jgi:hypothetical protein
MLRSTLTCTDAPRYERLASRDVLRALDPTEHNMERLNASARGSGVCYHALRLRGDVSVPALRRAIDVMTARHPLMRVRIAQSSETNALVFAPAQAAVPLEVIEVDDLDEWQRMVEEDMNAGPLASDRGPLYAFALLEPKGGEQRARNERLLMELHHHAVGDGHSSLWLCHELLEELTSPRPWPARPDREVESPFVLDDEMTFDLAELTTRARGLSPESDRSARDALLQELEALEEQLLAVGDDEGRLARRLFHVHSLIASLITMQSDRIVLRADTDIGVGPERYERAGTGFLRRALAQDVIAALRPAAKAQTVTVHAALTAAVLFAYAEHHWREGTRTRGTFALGTPVSLREQLRPRLERGDLRMAVDVSLTHTSLGPGDRFWDVARRTGGDVTRDVRRRRTLSSWFRTPPRDLTKPPPGVPLAIVSNLGQSLMQESYGELELLDVTGVMTTHGAFWTGMIFSTFRSTTSFALSFETPTIARASAERFADVVCACLEEAAHGREPVLAGRGNS